MIALSASENIWLLLVDHDDGGDFYQQSGLGGRSTWLNLETGEMRHFYLCKRVLFSVGWHEMPELQDKCDKQTF